MRKTVYLNKREEEIMRVLWEMKKAFVKEIIEQLEERPKPPYNTISSVVRKLEGRGLVGYDAFGKTHRYYPILKKEQYRRQALGSLVSNYFNGSVGQLVSHFVNEENVSMDEMEALLEKIKQREEQEKK